MVKGTRGKVQEVLSEVRPALWRHGGDVVLKGLKSGIVTLKVQGACRGCPMSKITFQLGVEKMLRDRVPEITEIKYS